MLRKLALSLAIAGAIGSSTAHALGLGEIRITSALNEPLKAEIQLLQMRSVDPRQVQPKMANVDDFALAGIERLRFLSDVKFEVKPGASGQGMIILTSSTPVKEPFLNFLLEVNWPSGRLVREYTVLLDPPVYDPTPPPVVVQPATTAPRTAPRPATTTVAPQQPVNNIRTRMSDNQVYVDVNDTLWDISKLHKPTASVTEAQMMLALLRKNPEAFRNNNVNQLRAGVVMDLPSLDEVRALSRQQANEEFWRQTQQWKQGITSPLNAEPLDTSVNTNQDKAVSEKKTNEVASSSAQGQLKIVSPDQVSDVNRVSDQAADVDMSQADASLLEKNQHLEAELATALETVDQIQRENEELSGRVDALAQQMESLQRLLELKDEQLAELQAELESAKNQPAMLPIDSAQAESEPVAPAQKTLIERFGLYIGAAGGALLAFLLALLLFRRSNKETTDSAVVPEAAIATTAAAAATAAVVEQANDDEIAEAVVTPSSEAESAEVITDDLDLDDLDLDMALDQVETDSSDTLNEDEFDLGFDDGFAGSAVNKPVDDSEDIDDALDSILEENADTFDLDDLDVPQVESLGDVPIDEPAEEPEADNIEALLAAGAESKVSEPVDDDTDLEFDIDSMLDSEPVTTSAVDEHVVDDDLDLDFDLATEDIAQELDDTDLESTALSDDLAFDSAEMALDTEGDDQAGELDELLSTSEAADIDELELDDDLQTLLDGNDDVVLDEEAFTPSQAEDALNDDLDTELDTELEMLLSDAGSDELSLDVTDDDAEDYDLNNLNLLDDADEVETKLDLARAYIDMEDADGAKDILNEILKEGSDAQKSEAGSLLSSLD
ncbi:FimV/HubP family polar landmark protein [Amphritea sp. 1_MG-2023]|uniref:FimV/HubP family polar landmark protein n=1 Tax=Amphritea sp. 1_MG-2023 TaxID=3062670 RepID=UPI0026E47C2B|nr:FimV/HubP family polar landmark protein [Amphritea sp. 1_MG-2023]MDO6564204.1 FimV/HubP family polar landmark protein [Amphritea sp. 1_MG-2023]